MELMIPVMIHPVKKIYMWQIEPPSILHSFDSYIGIDPGTVNFGVAGTFFDRMRLFQVTLDRDKDAIKRIDTFGFIMSFLETMIDVNRSTHLVIEGSGFGSSPFRQVELAECRTAIVCWMKSRNVDNIKIAPPNTIRKAVFGGGKVLAQDIWDNTEIPNDALAALSCLYYADYLEKEK